MYGIGVVAGIYKIENLNFIENDQNLGPNSLVKLWLINGFWRTLKLLLAV